MQLDQNAMLSDDQDLAIAASTVYSNVYNNKPDGLTTSKDAPNGVTSDAGKGNHVELLAQVTETFTSGGAGTLRAVLETSSDEAFTSPVALADTGVLAKATLVAGYQLLPHVLPQGGLQYYRVKYIVATAAMTAGKVTVGVTCGIQSNNK